MRRPAPSSCCHLFLGLALFSSSLQGHCIISPCGREEAAGGTYSVMGWLAGRGQGADVDGAPRAVVRWGTGSRELKLDPYSQELGWGPRAKYWGNWGQKRNLVFFRTPPPPLWVLD